MQSMFRLPTMPWTSSGIDKPPVLLQDQAALKGKRKRIETASPKPLTKKFKPQQLIADGGAVQGLSDQLLQNVCRFTPDGLQQTFPLTPALATPSQVLPGENQKPAHAGASIGSGLISPVIAPAPPAPALSVAPASVSPGVTTLTGKKPLQPATPISSRPFAASPLPLPAQQPIVAPVAHQQPAKLSTPPVVNASEVKPKPRPAMKIDTDTLRAIVEMEINNAILLKHNELRLIDQEIAKVQVAMEQIRRCQIIPKPAQQIPCPELMSHTGSAALPPRGYSVPESPAPWGVTDGPYTRHYATWLLPSSRFDPQSPVALASASTIVASPFGRESRSTRSFGTETAVSTPFGRSSRSVAGRVRASNANDPASPLTPRDPLVIKRQKDGLFVKLYCTSCNPERSDFANVQGFLNHCRISHKLDFKSHEAAAIECGRPVDPGDYFPPQPAEPQVSQAQALPQAQAQPPMSAREVKTPFSATSFSFPPPEVRIASVHSLNKPGVKHRDSKVIPRSNSLPIQKISDQSPAASFVGAESTPFLSSLLSKRGFAGNMSQIVTESKLKVDLTEYSDDSDAEATPGDKTGAKKVKKGKSKGHAKPAKPIAQTPRNLSSASTPPNEMMEFLSQREDDNMSPNTAATDYSNPGLVSDRDDEEYEEDDADTVDERVGSNRKERVMIVDSSMMETDEAQQASEVNGDSLCGGPRR